MAYNTDNPRIGTISNLQPGGSYDLLLITYPDGFPEGQIQFGINTTPLKVTGLQKVAQVFLKNLFTSKGSDPFYPNRGTDFPNLTTGANITLTDKALLADLQSSINDAASQTSAGLNALNSDTSSCLESVQILGVDTFDEGFVMYIYLRTLDGNESNLAVPFPSFGLPS